MKRKFRLTSSTDFKRVRQSGKSFAHPLIVLITIPNQLEWSRIGVVAGRALGNAVKRNRAKRRLRAALQPIGLSIIPGWDLIVIARAPLLDADFIQLCTALRLQMKRAGVLSDSNGKEEENLTKK